MTEGDDDSDGAPRRTRYLRVLVGFGIALFVSGFVLTVTSLSEAEAVAVHVDSQSTPGDAYDPSRLTLVLGLVMSLAGVVMATVGPAAHLIRSQRPSA